MKTYFTMNETDMCAKCITDPLPGVSNFRTVPEPDTVLSLDSHLSHFDSFHTIFSPAPDTPLLPDS